jgi:hypothetical protein
MLVLYCFVANYLITSIISMPSCSKYEIKCVYFDSKAGGGTARPTAKEQADQFLSGALEGRQTVTVTVAVKTVVSPSKLLMKKSPIMPQKLDTITRPLPLPFHKICL